MLRKIREYQRKPQPTQYQGRTGGSTSPRSAAAAAAAGVSGSLPPSSGPTNLHASQSSTTASSVRAGGGGGVNQSQANLLGSQVTGNPSFAMFLAQTQQTANTEDNKSYSPRGSTAYDK